MHKHIRLFLGLTALIVASLACGGQADDPNAPTRTPRPTKPPEISIELEVINDTQVPLCYLYVAPSDKDFRIEYLDGEQIAPGDSFTTGDFKTGEYNVRIHDCNQNMVNALYYVTMDQEHMTWTISEATLEIDNESSLSVCELYISPSSAPESAWGPNQLGDETFEPGMYASFFLAKGKWDIRAVPCDEAVEPITEIGLKVEDTLTWTISDQE